MTACEIHLDETCQPLPEVRVGDASLHAIGEVDCIHIILNELSVDRGGWVATHNLDHLRRLRSDAAFAAACTTAQLRVADGMPVVWASYLSGRPLPERVAGSSLIHSLTAAAAAAGRSVYFIGGELGTAQAAAERLSARHSNLLVAGLDCPPPGFEADAEQIQRLREKLITAQPDIVYVALGSPKQEMLIVQLRELLPNAWFLGVGISFSFVCGRVKRAPKWVQAIGMEWAHRLVQEPGRLAKRYLLQGLPFAALLFADALRERCRRTFVSSKS